jgi:FkbM family methyltransferase
MKITLHKKIAAYFGYEFTRTSNSIYEDQTRHTLELIKRHGIDLVLDVGANMGQFSIDLRDAGYSGQIISFEPITECYEHLKSIADNNWQIENYALGDANTTSTINISSKTVFSSILDTNDFGHANFSDSIQVVDKQTIEVKKLDDVINGLIKDMDKKKIFLKLDTQGYDDRVMLGAVNTLAQVYLLQTEVSCKAIYKDTPPFYETLKQMTDGGFNITGIFPLSRDKNTMELLEFDCLMIKAGLK